MKRFNTIRILMLGLSIAAGAGISYYYFGGINQGPIYNYVPDRDTAEMIKIFKQDWYWLSNREWDQARQELILKTSSPNEYEPRYFGKMAIKVLRENDHVVGFV